MSQVSDKCRCRGALRRSSIGNKMGKNWQKHWFVNKWWGPPLSGCHHWRIFRYVILCGNKCRWPILQTETRGNTSQEWQELALYSSVVVLAGWWMVSPVPAPFLAADSRSSSPKVVVCCCSCSCSGWFSLKISLDLNIPDIVKHRIHVWLIHI